jgi:hypothetical protein
MLGLRQLAQGRRQPVEVLKLSASVNMFMGFIAAMPGGPERKALVLSANRFGLRSGLSAKSYHSFCDVF